MTKLFGSSGVRGVVNAELTPILAARLGCALATLSKAKRAVLARDTRTSGLMFEDSLASSLVSSGIDVCILGVLPSPTLAFLTRELGADLGIMVTASHNPPQYNGVKIFDSNGMAFDQRSQNKVEKIIESGDFALTSWQAIGQIQHADRTDLYTEAIRRSIRLSKSKHIVLDPGCGATYSVAPAVMKSLGCKITAVNSQPDGFFPAREPEPNAESLRSTAKIVKDLGADIGLAYDGDGDRVAFINEEGSLMDFDRTLAAYAAYVTKRRHGGIVVTNVEASMCVEETVERYGGKVVRTKVGDVYISEMMKKCEAIFGGEPCGAWIHPEHHYCPDGILSSALLLKALDEEEKNLTEMISEIPTYKTVRKNVPLGSKSKDKIMTEISNRIGDIFTEESEISTVDGVRVSLEDGWILIRASGTEPVLRVTAEGESLKIAENIVERGISLIERFTGKVNR